MGQPTGRAANEFGGSAWDGEWIKKVRGEDFTGLGANSSGTSIFDPVLCELMYCWFCPPEGLILDPFAGGSVRGIVASVLGRRYIGIDLRAEQVEANQQQAQVITPDNPPTWIVGDSRNLDEYDIPEVDFVFSCPPYYNLEVYSDNPADLSTLGTYKEFIRDYRLVISKTTATLKLDSFACFVVGDIRGKDGFYCNFVRDTITAFEDCGLRLYNDAVLITAVGSLPIRVRKQFEGGRKLGKTHQNVLVFCNGDARKATEKVGDVYIMDLQSPDDIGT